MCISISIHTHTHTQNHPLMFPLKDSGCCNISQAINAPNPQILVPKYHSRLKGISGPRLLSSLAESSARVSKVRDEPRTSFSRK